MQIQSGRTVPLKNTQERKYYEKRLDIWIVLTGKDQEKGWLQVVIDELLKEQVKNYASNASLWA